ncbi:hypothetical protein BH24CHL6_BH24CHL6_14410 [soil metagenome]
MEGLLIVVTLLVVFAFGPVVAMLDVLSRELVTPDGRLDGSRLAKALLVLFVPLAWIVYFAVFRRGRPFEE